MNQIFSLIGASLILFAFVGLNYQWMSNKDHKYHWLNFVGACFLLTAAIMDVQYGFIILQAVWAFVSLKEIVMSFFSKKMEP